jgi:hypothetical protein
MIIIHAKNEKLALFTYERKCGAYGLRQYIPPWDNIPFHHEIQLLLPPSLVKKRRKSVACLGSTNYMLFAADLGCKSGYMCNLSHVR